MYSPTDIEIEILKRLPDKVRADVLDILNNGFIKDDHLNKSIFNLKKKNQKRRLTLS